MRPAVPPAPPPAPPPSSAPLAAHLAAPLAAPRAADAALSEFAGDATRPASLWPDTGAGNGPDTCADTCADTTRPGSLEHSGFAHTRFDPIAEERAALQVQAAAAFDVCHPALALRAVLLVQAVLAIVALAGAGTAAQWGARQAVLAFGGVVATLLWLVTVCALQRVLRSVQAATRTALVLALGMASALLAAAPLWWAGLAGDVGLPVAPGGFRIAAVALSGLSFAALLWAWLDLRARLWHPAHASARLAELQSRIRPHFLFNALNTALALVQVDPERAERVLEDLAQLFRVALAEVGTVVTLEEEVELARRYLDIEQVRFGPRLQVQWDVDPRTHGARLPPLVLQPLVENAVRHGIEPSPRGGRVAVRAQVQRGQVVVVVSNTLSADDGPGNPGHGMALHNVRERLRLLHDVAAQCDVWREGSGADAMFHARITLPLR